MNLRQNTNKKRMPSPEQLDQLIQITSPMDWLALLSICGILIAFIIWSIFGTISIELSGVGILIEPGGYRIIESPIEGEITSLPKFNQGDIIKSGQVVAEVAQPLLKLQIESEKDYLADLQKKADDAIKNHLNTLEQIKLTILDSQSKLEFLEHQLLNNSRILSPFTGTFIYMRTNVGSYIRPGDSILSMENIYVKRTAIVFINPFTTNINAIKPGMKTKVFPGLEKNSEFGYILGKVRSVSKFPASHQAMMAVLNNDYLSKFFSQKGPPYVIFVDLESDPNTVSGYKWSSEAGREISIKSGSFCSVLIQVARKAPIHFLFPSLKK